MYIAVVVTLCLDGLNDWSFFFLDSLQLLLLWLLLRRLWISFNRVLLTCHYAKQVSNRVVYTYRADVAAPTEYLRSAHSHVAEADSVVPVVHNFFFWRLKWLVQIKVCVDGVGSSARYFRLNFNQPLTHICILNLSVENL